MLEKAEQARGIFALPAGRTAKRVVIGLWLLLLALAVPVGLNIGSVQSDDARDRLPADAESTRVTELVERIPGGEGDQVLVVQQRDGGITEADRTWATGRRDALGASGMPPVTSDDGRTLLYQVERENPGEDEERTAAFVEEVRLAVAQPPPGLTVQVTGPSAIGADIDAVFEGIDETLMMVTTAVVALLLIITYRSPFLWLLPLAAVGGSAVVAMAALYGIASAAGITVSTQSFSIMIVLVFGAGTDYAMLLVARYREELRRVHDVHQAMGAALRGAGPAVLASAGTVTLGLLCLLAARMNDLSGLGLAGAVGIACTLLTMLTLFPALLVLTGRRVFWPKVPRYGAPATANRGIWAGVAQHAVGKPVRTAAAGAAVLGVFALGLTQLGGDLGETGQFTDTPESVAGYATLGQAFPEQSGRPLTVVTDSSRAADVTARATAVPGVADAEPAQQGDGLTVIEVHPAATPDSQEEFDTVSRLRAAVGPDALVGGPAAEELDTREATTSDNWRVLPLVLAVVLLVLVLLLRKVLASLVVVGTVLLCFAAALGIGAVAFDLLFGFAGTAANLPALCFVFGVALGVDYSIFLVARIRDDAPRLGTKEATRRAVTSTGGVIASAGLVLAATFAVLASLPFVPMVELGFAVAAGVLLQTLVVQPLLVAPLLVALPGKMER
ncbi:MMPL family transporter [Amycolatopsis sp. 195334CR]|uniref:MMPL family transporter n=1 Tax=Amycolatopsis sp. 195334CR TaxID=2814588 RepID=UPI001A9002EB|nr:MMPL family transporter [Amycolatopsis sp. 195334CR]MBN6037531.1 MMPL family transporter [Amycolatopsis sp. 195334CR]